MTEKGSFCIDETKRVIYLQNRTVTVALNVKATFEMWIGTKADISNGARTQRKILK